VELGIRVRPPLLNDLYVNLLTDKTLLKKRWEKAKLWAGDRADLQMARPIDALDYLTTYLTDCLNPQKGKARIPLLNKKFLKTFGKDCDVILNELGFEYKCEVEEDGSKVEAWYLPAPPADSDPLLPDTESAVIRDALCELSALMLSLPEHERTNTRRPVMAAQPALHLIERALACEGCKSCPPCAWTVTEPYGDTDQKKPLQSTRSASSEEEHP
jgi:ubiquitin carboxyl-terminal hydrolase 25/28